MAKGSIPVQVLAVVGLATVLAGAHSLFLPIVLTRENSGFVIPEGPTDPLETERAAEAPTPEQPNAADADSSSNADGKVSLDQAVELHDRAMSGMGVVFLDARRRVDFDAGRVMGALYMEHTHVSSGEGLDEIMTISPPEFGDLLVIYCTGGDCQASEDTAILLEQAGYTNIAIMAAGYDQWAAAGLPTEEGP